MARRAPASVLKQLAVAVDSVAKKQKKKARVLCGIIESGGPVSSLTIFGLVAIIAMLVFYALEKRSPWYILAFAGTCVLSSIYGFLQGAWPFGAVEIAWTIVALRRWSTAIRPSELGQPPV